MAQTVMVATNQHTHLQTWTEMPAAGKEKKKKSVISILLKMSLHEGQISTTWETCKPNPKADGTFGI
jgi:hypothetical protein